MLTAVLLWEWRSNCLLADAHVEASSEENYKNLHLTLWLKQTIRDSAPVNNYPPELARFTWTMLLNKYFQWVSTSICPERNIESYTNGPIPRRGPGLKGAGIIDLPPLFREILFSQNPPVWIWDSNWDPLPQGCFTDKLPWRLSFSLLLPSQSMAWNEERNPSVKSSGSQFKF